LLDVISLFISIAGVCMRDRCTAQIMTVAFTVALCVLLPMRTLTVPPNDFMLIAWNEGRNLLDHGAVSLQYPYPLWTQILLLPFVLVSPELGAQLWFICSLLLLAVSIVGLMDLLGWPLRFPVVVIVSLFVGAFGPVFTTLWLGQLNFLPLLALVLLAKALRSNSWMNAGIALGLGLIKPQLIFLVTAVLFAVAAWERRWRIFLGWALVLCLFIAISIPFAINARQVFGSGVAGHLNAYLARTSTLWGLCLTWAPDSLWLPAIVSCLLAGWLGYRWFRVVQTQRWSEEILYLIGITTIVNLLVSPYSWFYNQVVLILPLSEAVDQIQHLYPPWRTMWLVIIIVAAYFLPTAIDVALTRVYDSEVYQVIPVIALFFVVGLLHWQLDYAAKPVVRGAL
jgi:glycosyl transferase family 87